MTCAMPFDDLHSVISPCKTISLAFKMFLARRVAVAVAVCVRVTVVMTVS